MNIDPVRPGDRVLCAVSGGADSMYLLCRMLELAGERGFEVHCAHFGHGMRGAESARDAAFVAAFCAERSVPCHVGRGNVRGGECDARAARYAFLSACAGQHDCRWIATAHTADDHAETMLLQLARGAGLRGLGGIAPVRGNLLRPMLDVTRGEVETYLAAHGVPHVEDSTNASSDYARNRVRQGAMPALKSVNSAFARHTVRTAALLREDEAFLVSLAEDFLREQGSAPEVAALAALQRPVRARVFALLASVPLEQCHIEALHALCSGTEAAEVSLPGGECAVRESGRLSFSPAVPEPWPEAELLPGGAVCGPDGKTITLSLPEPAVEIHNTLTSFYFKSTEIHGTLSITPPKPGDRIRLLGRGCTKKLSDLFSESGLERSARAGVPVLRDELGVAAVFGYGMAERLSAVPGDMTQHVVLKSENIQRGSTDAGKRHS